MRWVGGRDGGGRGECGGLGGGGGGCGKGGKGKLHNGRKLWCGFNTTVSISRRPGPVLFCSRRKVPGNGQGSDQVEVFGAVFQLKGNRDEHWSWARNRRKCANNVHMYTSFFWFCYYFYKISFVVVLLLFLEDKFFFFRLLFLQHKLLFCSTTISTK